MKRTSITIMLALTIIWALVACSDKNESNEDAANNEDSVENEESESAESDSVEEDEDDDDLTTLLETIEDADDQLDLSLGDTGSFVTTLGTYDMTVTSAESKGYEFEGIESELDDWILLDVTIKNTSDEPLDAEDLISSMELTEDLDGSGYSDSAGAFDEAEEFEGEIEPGEEKSAQFVAYAYESDTYYFRKNSGNIAGGSSNQLIWNINTSDMEK